MADLIDQPTAAPTRKVAAFTIAGVFTAAIMAGLQAYNPDLALTFGPFITQAVPVVVGFVVAYFTRNAAA